MVLRDKKAIAPDGRFVTLQDVALESLHHKDQHQIMAVASYVSPKSPPPFAAQYAQVLVDTETGQITVEKLVMAVDSGVIVNPATASGQIEGGMTQALGYAVCEEMLYDARGDSVIRQLGDYKIFAADEMPELQTIFVETFEPSHPFGLKAVAEIPLDGVAPAVANAVYDAVGIWMREIPMTPERVWRRMCENEVKVSQRERERKRVVEQERADQSLRDSAALYYTLIEDLPQSIFLKDLEGRFLRKPAHVCRSRQAAERHRGQNGFRLSSARVGRHLSRRRPALIQRGKVFKTIEEHPVLGGEKTYVQVVKAPIHDFAWSGDRDSRYLLGCHRAQAGGGGAAGVRGTI